MEAFGGRVGAIVGEEDAIAFLGEEFKADVWEDGAAAGFGGLEDHDQRSDAVAALLEGLGGAGDGGVEVVVVGVVFAADIVAQDLDSLAAVLGPCHEVRDPIFDLIEQRHFAHLEEHAIADAGVVGDVIACLVADDAGGGEPWFGGLDECVALLIGEEVSEEGDGRGGHRHDDLDGVSLDRDPSPPFPDLVDGHGGLAEGFLEGFEGGGVGPAGSDEALEERLEGVAGLGVIEDPAIDIG